MSAGRKTSVTRHIDNPNIHGGDGRPVRYGSKRAESENRPRQYRPLHRMVSSDNYGTGDLRLRIEKEVENLIVKEVAKRIFESLPKNDPKFTNLEIFARGYIFENTSNELFRIGSNSGTE